MNQETKNAVSAITSLYVRTCELEDEKTSDDLDFLVWIAAFATAGVGLVLIRGADISAASWMDPETVWAVITAVQVILTLAILLALVVRLLINARLDRQRAYVNLLGAQEAKFHADLVKTESQNLVTDIISGMFLPDESRKMLINLKKEIEELDAKYNGWMKVQLALFGVGYVLLVVAGIQISP